MEIKFEKLNGVYTAEFEITSNCNIHIEREELGMFTIESRGSKQGKYVPMEEGHYGDKYIIDVDMLGNIYPKYIKITSVSKPTYAEVNFAEQGGGNSGGGGEIVYFDLRAVDKEFAMSLVIRCCVCKLLTNNNFNIAPNTIIYGPYGMMHDILTDEAVDYVLGCGIQCNEFLYAGSMVTPNPMTLESLLTSEFTEEQLEIYNNIPRITKEEYDNLQPNK